MKRSILSLIAMSCIIVSGCGGGGSSSGDPEDQNPVFTSHFEDTAWVKAIAVQNDGKILVGGDFINYDSKTVNGIVRLNADGSIDTSFNTGTGVDFGVIAILIQNDGKVILAGDFSKFNGAPHDSIVRLNSDGSVDTTFVSGTGFDAPVKEAVLQPDGKILIAGWQTKYNGTATKYITRLNSNGTIDSAFSGNLPDFTESATTTTEISAIALQKDGKILVGGRFITTATDPGSGGAGVSAYRKANAPIPVMLLTYNNIARLNSDGSIDASFYSEGTDSNISTIAIQSDDKIIIGGSFTKYNTTSCNRIMRLKADGSPDTFSTGTGFNDSVSPITIQDDGKILVGGNFTSFNGTSRGHIARLNSDGSLDTTFATGSGTDNFVMAIVIGSNDRIFIGGIFETFNGEPHAAIACLDK